MEFTQVPPEQWPDKSTVKKCMRCDKSFGLFRTGSHCRGCGQVFCTNTCLPYRFTLPVKQSGTGNLSYSGEPVPVCASCAEKLSRLQEAHKEKQGDNADISAAKNNIINEDKKLSVQVVKSENDIRKNEELDDQLSRMQELLSAQKAASDILINESTTLRSENALVLEKLKEMEQQLLQKKEEYEQLYHELEREKVEKKQAVTAEVEEEKQKLQKMLEQRHEERLQTMERQVKDNTEKLLLEQRSIYEERNQTWLQNVLNILFVDVNDVRSIVIEERDAFVQLVKAMMSEVIVKVKTNVTSHVKEQEIEIKQKALLELHEQLDKEWALKEQQLLKEQREYEDHVHVAEMNAIKVKTQKEFAECESEHNAEMNALQKRWQVELEARLQEERALHVKESNEERAKYEQVQSKEQNAKAQEHLLANKQSELINTEMQARIFIQTDEHNNFVELLLLSYAQTTERKYFDNQASHEREVEKMKDEFDAEFLEQHVNIIENYKSKLSEVEEEHKQQVSRLREQLTIAESTVAQLQQEKKYIEYNKNGIHMGSDKTNDGSNNNNNNNNNEKMLHKVSEMCVSEMSFMYDLWLTEYESILAHIQILNKNNYNVMQPLHTQSLQECDNKQNSAVDACSITQRQKRELEQLEQHQHLQEEKEQKIEAEKRERKRLALQLARSAQEITELSKANTKLRSKLEKSEARVKALSTRLPLPQKTPAKHTNSEQPTPPQIYKSEIKNRATINDGNNTNMHESNDVALDIDEDNNSSSLTDKQIILLQYKEKEWWQYVNNLIWQYATISSAYFTESSIMHFTETLVHLWKEENRRKEISDRSALALEQTTSTIKLLQDSLHAKSNELMHKEKELQRATRKMVKQKAHALNCVKRMHALLAHLKEQEELSNYNDSVSDVTDMSPSKNAIIHSSNSSDKNQENTITTSALQSSHLPSPHELQGPITNDKCNDD